MIYFEAPLHINLPAGGAIGACPAFDGRGRGWVRKTIGAEKDRNLKLIRCNLFGNLFSHSLSKGDYPSQSFCPLAEYYYSDLFKIVFFKPRFTINEQN